MFDTYKPSGGFRLRSAILLLLFLSIGVGIAYLYQLLLAWIQIIYITVILTLFFGASLGGLGRAVVRIGHIRSPFLGISIGLIIAVTSYSAKFWFQYEATLDTYLTQILEEDPNRDPVETKKQLRSEVTFVRHLQDRVEIGWRVNGGLPIQGVFVYLIWIIEAGIIFVFATRIPANAASEPYSEKLGQWVDQEQAIMMLPIDKPEMVSQIMESKQIDDLLTLPIPKTDETNQFALYLIHSITGQELEDAYLTVKLITISYDKDGNEQRNEKLLVRNAILNSEQLSRLNENAELLGEAIEAFREFKASQHAPAEADDSSQAELDEFKSSDNQDRFGSP